MQEALYFQKLTEGQVQCNLCPRHCVILPGKSGNCRVRKNIGGALVSEVYGKVASMAVDPIEKKPLYHFFPGKKILSIGNVGCNLHCIFCQNHDISQCNPDEFFWFKKINPEQITVYSQQIEDNIGVAYTYNEPFTFYETMKATALEIKDIGMKNVVVSNGYINEEPVRSILPYLDAFNIDLKSFSDEFYRKITKGTLRPVLNTLKIIADSGAHLEITNLVIPQLNDDDKLFREMVKWIAGELGPHVPLHLSRYFPRYKLTYPSTPEETLGNLYAIAKEVLHHVFVGNISSDSRSDSICPGCGTPLILRNNYFIKLLSITENGQCSKCGFQSGIIL